MNKTTEALKLAEEALVEYRDNQHIKAPRKTLAAIRSALAEQDHIASVGKMVAEPVCKRCNGTKIVSDGEIDNIGGADLEVPIECVRDCPDCAEPVQEPVAWKADGQLFTDKNFVSIETPAPLYAEPVQREWVDLTDDEIDELKRDYCIKADASCWWEAVGAVIAAFKGKNK